jgi:hypothetical protein
MKRAAALLLAASMTGCLPAPLRDSFHAPAIDNNAVHRYFPDLDQRANAIRYGRWRALEETWTRGVTEAVDLDLSSRLLRELRTLPDYPPDVVLAAPVFCRELPVTAGALAAAEVFEREVADSLAAPDSSPERTDRRLERALNRYRDSGVALIEPAAGAKLPAELGSLATARLLLAGDWLLAAAADDLSGSDYSDQRWKVKSTVDAYDARIENPPGSIETRWYGKFAPALARRSPAATEALDRATRFRVRVFGALRASSQEARRSGVTGVEKDFGLAR